MENSHPIEGLMKASMSSIENMVDVNTIIGEPIETVNNIVIIPISKVSFGFAAGGSEFSEETIDEYLKKDKDDEEIKYKLPFGGGAGAGVSINPVAFIVVQEDKVKLMPITHLSTLDKLIDYVPDVIEKMINRENKKVDIKDELKDLLKENKKEERTEEKRPKIKKEEYEIEYQEDEDLDD